MITAVMPALEPRVEGAGVRSGLCVPAAGVTLFNSAGTASRDLAALADGLLRAAELGNGAYSQLDRYEWFPGLKVN